MLRGQTALEGFEPPINPASKAGALSWLRYRAYGCRFASTFTHIPKHTTTTINTTMNAIGLIINIDINNANTPNNSNAITNRTAIKTKLSKNVLNTFSTSFV